MKPLTVLFFGSQGAGKGTQVKMLIDLLRSKSDRGIIRIDMGQELRNLRDTGTYAGKLTGEIIDNGIRIYDFMAVYLQTKLLIDNFTGEEHIIADGLARGDDQTRGFDDMMKFFKRDDLQVVNLVISDDTAVKRLMERGRNDDTEEAIRRRLAWTKTDVLPQLGLLKGRGRTVHEIDGEPDVKTIHKNILAALGLS
ncbi:MAG: nucleoside monophosphate kinase [Patescibacteria group bacterium]|nr:nucleoside monophosphate kinase [bacterium]MDZ4227099.1 nucleoside monophosphate kinase [Patescibacteria group bacterium]